MRKLKKIKYLNKLDFLEFSEYHLEVEGVKFYIQQKLGETKFELAGMHKLSEKSDLVEALQNLRLCVALEADDIINIGNDFTYDKFYKEEPDFIRVYSKFKVGEDYDLDKYLDLGDSDIWEAFFTNTKIGEASTLEGQTETTTESKIEDGLI